MTITGEQVAQLYYKHIYWWFGLPSKMILDRDPRFTSNFAKALCARLGVQQNILSAFHPQTDGLSENKNQWVELFLRHLTSAQQDDWAKWLPIAMAAHNHYTNATTKVAPSEALLGYLPCLDFLSPPSMNDRVEERSEVAFQKRMQARTAINLWAGSQPLGLFKTGDRVWLEAKNLKLPYQSLKLAPKRHGPFRIKRMISSVAAQLELPPAWTIHDVFHTGLLTMFKETHQYGDNFPRPPPDIIDGEEEFEVEAIINHRYFGRRHDLQYLVKWLGYPDADNSWERHQDIFTPQLIQDYHRCHPLQDKRRGSQRKSFIRSLHSWPTTPPPLPLSSMSPHTSLSPRHQSAMSRLLHPLHQLLPLPHLRCCRSPPGSGILSSTTSLTQISPSP